MAAVVNTEKCVGCGDCKSECPCGAIEIVNGKAVVSDDCAGCGVCESVCKEGAITVE